MEISVGHLKSLGRRKMMVETKDRISKAFCHAASTEENEPRFSGSTD
jgi:hypothetical protein